MITGTVGDMHEPFAHPLYRQFCADTFDAWRADDFLFIGDVVDNHAISFHDNETDGHGANLEADLALAEVEKWHKMWPKARVCIGNHDELPQRKGSKGGLPQRFMADYAHVWNTSGWNWQREHESDGVSFIHGTGLNGKYAAVNHAKAQNQSIVMGHIHSRGYSIMEANRNGRIFGAQTGCGVDISAYSFRYAKLFKDRCCLGCMVVADGVPYFEPMPCGPKEKYHKSKAGKKRRKELI